MKRLLTMFTLVGVVGVLGLSTSVLASQFAIVGGKVHTLTGQGTLAEATVLIKDGKVEQIIAGSTVAKGI